MKRTLPATVPFLSIYSIQAQSILRVKQFNLENGLTLQRNGPVVCLTVQKTVKGDKRIVPILHFYPGGTTNSLAKRNKEESTLLPQADIFWRNYFK